MIKFITVDEYKPFCVIEPGRSIIEQGIELVIDNQEHNWSEPETVDNNIVRFFNRSGSVYHRVPFIITEPNVITLLNEGKLQLEIEYKDTACVPCLIEIFHPGSQVRSISYLGNKGTQEWKNEILGFVNRTELETIQNNKNRYGTQKFIISRAWFSNRHSEETFVYDVGDHMTIHMEYEILDKQFKQKPIIQVIVLIPLEVSLQEFRADHSLSLWGRSAHPSHRR